MGLVAKAFQDIITFSRASAGTYVNSNGYITNSSVLNYLTYSNAPDNAAWTKSNSFVQTNLLTNSEDFNSWSKSSSAVTVNSVIAPDGTLTADKIIVNAAVSLGVATGAGVRQDTTKAASPVTYTRSFYAKAGEFNSVVSFMSNTAATSSAYATFNLSNGTFTGPTASGFTSASASITNEGNGWYRCVLTATTDSDTGMRNSMFPADTVATTGNGTSGIYLWGAQTVQGSVPGNYQATTSAALPVLYADYNGVVRARKLGETTAVTLQHAVVQGVTATAGAQYATSIYLKAGERTCAQVRYENGGSTAYWAVNVDLITGASTTSSFGTPTSTGATVQSVGNGWWRVSLTAASSNTTWTTIVYAQAVLGTNNYTGDGSSGIYIADAQVNDGSTAGAYYDTTASAYNAPRFDYDPVTLAAKGLLIEEQRANQLLQSNDFATTWTPISVTITQNSTLSPDGNVNADTITASATAVGSRIQQDGVVSLTSQYVYSCYVRPGTVNTVSLSLYNNTTATALATVNFNVATGVVVTTTVGTGTITPAGNGWYRCSVTHSGTVTATNSVRSYVYPNNTSGTTGDSVIIYGAQLEAGAFATSYIPTTTSQVTRAADVASVNTLSPWYNSVAGTFYFEGDTAVPASLVLRNLTNMNDGTVNNLHRTYLYNGIVGGSTTTGGVTQADVGGGSYTVNTAFKFAYAATVNSFAAVLNGGAPATDALGTLPSGLTTFEIASSFAGTVNTGHIRRITYYPRRLTNAELQTLTTL